MWIKELDTEVYNAIWYFKEHNESISFRKIAKQIWKINSIRSVQLSVERLIKEWKITKSEDWVIQIKNDKFFTNIKTRWIPLLWSIACWTPIFAEENIESYIPIWVDIVKEVNDYFILYANGDSMNKEWINDWDMVLIKQQNTAQNWDIVVALINDEATLKKFQMWNGMIKLIPNSTNEKHKPIIVTENLIIQWVYVKNLGKF